MALLETLSDPFDGNSLDTTKWTDTSTTPGTIAVGGGVLTASTGSSTGAGEITSATSYTFGHNSQVVVKLTRSLATATAASQFSVSNQPTGFVGGGASIYISGTTILTRVYDSAGAVSTVSSQSYSATSHAWLRMRFDIYSTATIYTYFDCSADGVNWTALGVATATGRGWTGNACYVRLRSAGNGDATVRTDTWDSLSLNPPPTFSNFQEDFLGTTLNTNRWSFTYQGANNSVSGSLLYLSTSSSSASNYSRVTSTGEMFNLIGPENALTLRVGGNDAAGNRTEVQIQALDNSGYALIRRQNTALHYGVWNSSGTQLVYVTTGSFTFPGCAYWRFRLSADGATMYLETSPDLQNWSQLTSASSPGWGRSCRVQLATNNNTTSYSGNSWFDSIVPPGTGWPEYVQDEFLADTLDSAMWATTTTGGGTVSPGQGVVTFTTDAGSTTSTAQIQTVRTSYRLQGSWVSVCVPMASATANVKTYLTVFNTGSSSYALTMGRLGTNLVYFLGTSAPTTITTYSPVNHKYWRILLDPAGAISLQTSANGTSWTTQVNPTYQSWATSIGIRFYVQNNGAAVTGASVLDAVNLLGTGTSLEKFTDDFPGSTLDPGKWLTPVTVGAGSSSVGSGLLTFTTGIGATDSREIRTLRTDFNLINSYAYARVTPSSATGVKTQLAVYPPSGNGYIDVFQQDGTLGYTVVNTSNTTVLTNSVPFDPDVHLYWRIRMDASSTVFIETATDPTVWTQLDTIANPGWGAAAQLAMRIVNSATVATSGNTSRFDAINLPGDRTYVKGYPNTLAEIEAFGGPHIGQDLTIEFTEHGDPETLGEPVTEFIPVSTPDSIADAETFDSVDLTFENAPILPVSLANPETLGAPTVAVALSTDVDEIADAETFGDPEATIAITATPGSLTDPGTLGGPAVTVDLTTEPGEIADPETVGEPAALVIIPATPDSLTDPEAVGAPDTDFLPAEATPDGVTDAETFGDPDLTIAATAQPDSLAELEEFGQPETFTRSQVTPNELANPETLGPPDLSPTIEVEPVQVADPEALAVPVVGFMPPPPQPDSLADPQTLGNPSIKYVPSSAGPPSLLDLGVLGGPALVSELFYDGSYGSGDYGRGIYGKTGVTPAGIIDLADVGEPDIFFVPPVPDDEMLPLGIVDPGVLGEPQLPDPTATNYAYGAGDYGAGVYEGHGDNGVTSSLDYGYGIYGDGIYYGQAVPKRRQPPLFVGLGAPTPPAMHILGIGPWSPVIEWRGAPNYYIAPGTRPARPALALPPATSKGFTLRLGEGGEARCDLTFPRGSAVVIDEMDTDLWWRRKDPRNKVLEMIGRFNASHVNISTSDTGVNVSVQWEDYQSVLSSRMVLKYLDNNPTKPDSQWKVGHPIIDIIAWALPTNTRLDLSEATGDHPYDLGGLTQVFYLPPSTTMGDLFENLQAYSPNKWEWWIETPLDVDAAPKLMFAVGGRGRNNGIVLFDHGQGPTPIASWTRNGAADDYANSLYYTGSATGDGKDAGGGVVENIAADVKQYGQRDALDGSSSVTGGNVQELRRKAGAKLQKLADRRPSYTVRLKQGFWRGRMHIDIGDTVMLILRLGKDVTREEYRVTELTVDVDENNLEEVTLNLGRLPVSSDPRSKRSPLIRIVKYLKNYVTPSGAMAPDPDD